MALGIDGRRQHLTRARHRHFDLRTRLTGTDDRRRIVIGDAIALRTTIGIRVKLSAQVRRLGIDDQRNRRRSGVTGDIGFLDRNRHRTVRQLLLRRHAPVAVAVDRCRQNLIGTRHRHFDGSPRLARAADGRGLVIGNAITLGTGIGCGIELSGQGRGAGIQRGTIRHDGGLITGRIGDLRRHLNLAAFRRSRQFDDNLACINLGLGQDDPLIHVASRFNRQQIASHGALGQADFNTDRTLQLSRIDVSIVIGIFGDLDREAFKGTQVDLGQIASLRGLIPRCIDNQGLHLNHGTVNRRREGRHDVAVGLIGRSDRHILGHAIRGHLDDIADINQSSVKRNLDIDIAGGFGAVDETVVIGILNDINRRL